MQKRVLVTGSGGYIGSAVVRQLTASNFDVVRLTHSQPSDDHGKCIQADLNRPESLADCCRNIDVVIHIAARKNDETDSETVNVDGTGHLLRAAEAAGVQRFVYISTQSVKLPKQGSYARTKLAAEKLVQTASIEHVILRPSVVYDNADNGIIGSILQYTNLPVVPVLGSGLACFQPIHRDDLAVVIEKAATAPEAAGKTYDIGGPTVVTFNMMVSAALQAKGIRKPVVRLPGWIALLLARLFSVLPNPPVTRSNVLGAIQTVEMDIRPMLTDLKVEPRPFDMRSAIAPDKKPHPQEIFEQYTREEASTLLRYLDNQLSATALEKLQSDYMKAVQKHLPANTHRLDAVILNHPRLIGLLDSLSVWLYPKSVLRSKLLIAATIYECHPASAARLLPPRHSAAVSILLMIWHMMMQLLSFVVALPLLILPYFTRRNCGV